MENNIDFVIMWVDGNDPKWQKEKNKYSVKSNADATIYRYRDWNLLNYLFRGIEKFAPWVHRIFLVTYGHVPEWLDISNPKISIVKHSDFIPKEYLPTFSANTIELNIHRIKGLSERFVLFNDDFFIIKKVSPNDYFVNNIPKDTVALNAHCVKKSMLGQFFCINDVAIINEHFKYKESFKKNIFKWLNPKNGKHLLRTLALMNCPRFPGFWQHHLASSLLKSTYEELWEKEYDVLNETCKHKFRESTDVNQWLFKEWQIAQGNFINRSSRFGEAFFIDRDGIKNVLPKMINYINHKKGKMICINDGPMSDTEYENTVYLLKESLNTILPNKSEFEK